MAIEIAQSMWGIDIKPQQTEYDKLPFMGENGCVLEPHLRPLYTLHTCDINSFGCKMHPAPDPEWDKKYWTLRNKIDELEYELDCKEKL